MKGADLHLLTFFLSFLPPPPKKKKKKKKMSLAWKTEINEQRRKESKAECHMGMDRWCNLIASPY